VKNVGDKLVRIKKSAEPVQFGRGRRKVGYVFYSKQKSPTIWLHFGHLFNLKYNLQPIYNTEKALTQHRREKYG
jgi:hypothetical protein